MSSTRKVSSYEVFQRVDTLVSKPVIGSDGAASWQDFQKSQTTDDKTNNNHYNFTSRGVAPHIPLKKNDRLAGMKSIQEERTYEQNIRLSNGDRDMGSGYTNFKKKHSREEALERKRRKLIKERRRPHNVKYYIKAETFGGWKENYVFTTRNEETGYYWDGADALKKLMKQSMIEINYNGTQKTKSRKSESEQNHEVPEKKKKKKKSKKKLELPEGWDEAIDPSTCKTYYFNRALNKSSWDFPE